MTLIHGQLGQDLTALLGSLDRHYHGLAHIEALLALAQEYRALIADFDALEAAIWFHDAIYDSSAKDNEARSAILARSKLKGHVDDDRLNRIEQMILATATHQLPDFTEAGPLQDAALFLDMDLSILGAPPETFAAYEAAIRQEYSWVSDRDWLAGRSAVLRSFVDRPLIFHTTEFRLRFERQARQNMARSLARLTAAMTGIVR